MGRREMNRMGVKRAKGMLKLADMAERAGSVVINLELGEAQPKA